MTGVIDMNTVQELLDLCEDGDAGLLVELIEIFLRDGAAHARAVADGAGTTDLEKVERAAHALKGSSGNLGAHLLMAVAEQVQLASRTGQVDQVVALAPELTKRFAEAELALRELRERFV
jgi:HPt (histidine-containing phosphotransfer) domain-containing protein